VERYVPKPFLGSLGEGKGGGHTSDCSIPHKCGAHLDKSLDNFSCMCATASRLDLECHLGSRGCSRTQTTGAHGRGMVGCFYRRLSGVINWRTNRQAGCH
jgi:hypothetical protein